MVKRWFLRLILIGVGLAVALVAAELFLRAFPGVLSEDARLRLHWAGLGADDSTTVAHPTIGYVARPGFRETLERSDLSFTYEIDENGFRNPWPWPEQADVVVTGDSLSFGYGVDQGQGWTDMLLAAHEGLTLVNLGITGGAPQMGVRAYQAFGAPLRPKLLLFGLFLGNDVYDARKFDEWLAAGAEGNFGIWKSRGGRALGWQGRLYALLKRSYVFTAWNDLRKQKYFDDITVELSGGGRVQLVPDTVAGAVVKNEQSDDYGRILGAVQEAAEVTREDGVHMAVLYFPTKEEVYLPVAEKEAPDPLRVFRPGFEAAGITLIDPTAALREGALAGRQLYFEIDGHPNLDGYRVIADVVDAHLVENAEGYELSL